MNILVISTIFKSNIAEAISKNVFFSSLELSDNHNVTLLTPCSVEYCMKSPIGFKFINYSDNYNYNSSLSIVQNIYSLKSFLQSFLKNSSYDIVHFHIGFCFELFIISLLIKPFFSKDDICVATIWQPFIEIKDTYKLIKINQLKIFRYWPHFLSNSDLLLFLYRYSVPFFHKLIVSSRYQQNQIKRFAHSNKIHRIVSGVKFDSTLENQNIFNSKKILYLGHYTPAKGVDIVLDMFEYLDKNYTLTLALSDRTNIDVITKNLRQHKNKKNITIKGIVNVEKELFKHDLFIIPFKNSIGLSYYPNVILECFAAGLPILTTDFPVTRELIQNSVNGFIITTYNAKEVALKIIKILNNPKALQRISKNQQAIYYKKYSMVNYLFALKTFYMELLNAKKNKTR